MGNQNCNDLRSFFAAHPAPEHITTLLGTSQVQLICITCGFSVTQDAVDAGLPVENQDIIEAREAAK